MSKQLKFKGNDGREYTLEFTRDSIRTMERNGFVIGEIDSKPMTVLPQLFRGAFLANHKFTKVETIDEIYAKLTRKSELIEKLAEMYNETIDTLVEEPEEGGEGNIEWETSW